MSTKNRRPTRPKNPTPAQVDPVSRLREAIKNARRLSRELKTGDEDLLAKATMLQGVLSGDVIAASIHARARLQRENLRLRARLTHARLKTEAAKQILLDAEARRTTQTTLMTGDALQRIRDIYGLSEPRPVPALPPIEAEPLPALPPATLEEVSKPDNTPPTESTKE